MQLPSHVLLYACSKRIGAFASYKATILSWTQLVQVQARLGNTPDDDPVLIYLIDMWMALTLEIAMSYSYWAQHEGTKDS